MEPNLAGLDLSLGDVAGLEQVVDRAALTEVCRSFFDLFGLSVRVFAGSGALLADVHEQQSICRYVNGLSGGRSACRGVVEGVKRIIPDEGVVSHPCFTGARYRVAPVRYHGRTVGRFVIGPYLPAETQEVPQSLLDVDPGVDKHQARQRLAKLPRVRAETSDRIIAHLQGIIDLLLFSSHRAHLTSEMHVASVRESYRELAEKNDRLQAAYDKLKELDKLKSNFLATVSHELRTPLTSIIGYSEMLESGMAGDLNADQVDFVQTIHQKGDHLLALITSLLDLSKMEQGSLTVNKESVNASGIVDALAKNILPHAQKKNVTIDVDIADGLSPINGDPVRIKQILFNLADNAVKFTPEGGTIYLSAQPDEIDEGGGMGAVFLATGKPAVRFTVRDTGVGMPKEELPKIFDAFYQVDGSSTRVHGGAGLGLNIVKRLVDAHDGTVEVDSDVGQGTTFTVMLPCI